MLSDSVTLRSVFGLWTLDLGRANAAMEWRHIYSIASAVVVLLAVVLMSVSAGGWDLTGSKGTAMRSDLCDDQRDIPDGRGLFNQVCGAGGTERAFSGIHNTVNSSNISGTYRCACCGTPLFSAAEKFNSGTGWPSYTAPLDDALGYRKDLLQMGSTEVHCSTCGAHLGHAFDDGPQPTGLRYCINSVCLWYDSELSTVAAEQLPWILNAYLVLLLLFVFFASCCVLTKNAAVAAYPIWEKRYRRGSDHNSSSQEGRMSA